MIAKLHDRLKRREISSVELTKLCLERVRADQKRADGTNAFLAVAETEAFEQARDADARFARGDALPLTGIPLGIKDVLCTRGIPTTCASRILEGYVPPYDATAVARLKAQGAVILGKLNMDEFAMGGSNESSAFGAVRNPVNPAHVPGGSSGGSAAAVKAGLVAAALGSDTGGSVRLPAAYTGTVGLKPTYGAVSRYGLVAFASSLDQIGPMTATAEDGAILLSAIAGHDPADSTSANRPARDYVALMKEAAGNKLRLGVPKEYFAEGIQREVAAAVRRVLDALGKAGHSIMEVSLPHTGYSVAVYYIVAVSEASSNLSRFDGVRFGARRGGELSLAEMYRQTRGLFGEEVKRRIILGTFALSSGYYDAYYLRACRVRRLIRDDFETVFKSVDALVAPVAPTTAFKLGEKLADPLQMYLNDILTIPANLAGVPAISVPAGRDAKGLPIGAQFIGPNFSEPQLLALGRFVEENVHREEVLHEL